MHTVLEFSSFDHEVDHLLDSRLRVVLTDKLLDDNMFGDMSADHEMLFDLLLDSGEVLLVVGRSEAFSSGQLARSSGHDCRYIKETEGFIHMSGLGKRKKFHLGEGFTQSDDSFKLADCDGDDLTLT